MTVQRFYTRWAAVSAVLMLGYFSAGEFVFSAAGPVVDTRSKALAHYIMGVSADLNGMAAESVKEYEKSAALNGQEPLPHLRLAAYYARLGLLDKAVAQLKTVVRLDPKEPQAHYLLAMVYSSQNKFDLAAGEYELILKSASADNPENTEIYLYLAQLYSSERKFDEAIAQFNKILEVQPDNVSVYYLLGSIYVETGDRAKAKDAFKKVLALEPDHDGALNSLGYIYAEDGVNLDDALKMARRAVDLDPSNGAYYDTLGWVLYKKGMNAQALMALQKAEAYIQDPVLYDHMGDVYKAVKEFTLARKFWHRSLDMKPGQAEVSRKLEELEKVHAFNGTP